MIKRYFVAFCALMALLLLMGCDQKRSLQPVVTQDDLVELSGYQAIVLQLPYPREKTRLYFKKETSSGYVDYWSAFDIPEKTAEIKLLINPYERRLHYVRGPHLSSNTVAYYRESNEQSMFAYPEYEQFACPGGTMKLSEFYFVYSDEWPGRDLALGQAVFPEGDERGEARWMRITLIPESELPKGWLGHNQD